MKSPFLEERGHPWTYFEFEDQIHHFAIQDEWCPEGEYKPICGDKEYPRRLVYEAGYYLALKHVKLCQECLDHPDFPLYLLGDF